MIKPSFDKIAVQTIQLNKELPDRIDKVMAQLTYTAAEKVRDGVLARLPSGAEYEDYRKAIRLYRVSGTGSRQHAHTVLVKPKNNEIKKALKALSVIYVRPTRRLITPHADVLLLEQYGPWTTETLPFKPKASQATLVTKKVGARELDQVRKKNRRERLRYQPALARAGHRITRKLKQKDQDEGKRPIPPMILDALKLEFGDGGTKMKPAWKASILEFARSTLPGMLRSDDLLRRSLTDPAFAQWSSYPSRGDGFIPSSDLKSTEHFIKRLGLRF